MKNSPGVRKPREHRQSPLEKTVEALIEGACLDMDGKNMPLLRVFFRLEDGGEGKRMNYRLSDELQCNGEEAERYRHFGQALGIAQRKISLDDLVARKIGIVLEANESNGNNLEKISGYVPSTSIKKSKSQ